MKIVYTQNEMAAGMDVQFMLLEHILSQTNSQGPVREMLQDLKDLTPTAFVAKHGNQYVSVTEDHVIFEIPEEMVLDALHVAKKNMPSILACIGVISATLKLLRTSMLNFLEDLDNATKKYSPTTGKSGLRTQA